MSDAANEGNAGRIGYDCRLIWNAAWGPEPTFPQATLDAPGATLGGGEPNPYGQGDTLPHDWRELVHRSVLPPLAVLAGRVWQLPLDQLREVIEHLYCCMRARRARSTGVHRTVRGEEGIEERESAVTKTITDTPGDGTSGVGTPGTRQRNTPQQARRSTAMRTQRDVIGEIRSRNGEIRTILDRVDDEHETLEGADVKRLHNMVDELEDLAAEAEERFGASGLSPAALYGDLAPHRRPNVGDAVVNDAAFKAWLRAIAPRSGAVSGAEFRNSPEIELRSLFDDGAMKTVVSTANAGALVRPDRTGIVDPGPFRRPLVMRDLITLSETDSDTVEYVRVIMENNAAAPTPEATSPTTGLKPESGITFQLESTRTKCIPHWLPASRRILGDAKQLRSYINGFLRYGLEEELEDQILTGNGVGENLTGILSTSGTTPQNFDTNIIKTARKARTLVRTVGRARPLAYVMNPVDWEAYDLSVDNEERYYFGGPAILGVPKLWGLPVVECDAVPVGSALVADWRLATLWDQEQARIYISDSHADFFARNLIAILAEMRAAFAVIRPAAFVEFALS